ncbi:unnamed protein product [Rotaria sp. Silwood2]|nr:unnamed protein product [Rotaria sp. Silwood2]CAF4574834.1 unnamed protein product [Rotaria sp. Silwood2]
MIIEHQCKTIIKKNKSHIISINLLTTKAVQQFLKQVNINILFNCLQSLVINGIVEHKIQLIVKQLAYLPNFSSLKIFLIEQLESFDTISKLIFLVYLI